MEFVNQDVFKGGVAGTLKVSALFLHRCGLTWWAVCVRAYDCGRGSVWMIRSCLCALLRAPRFGLC